MEIVTLLIKSRRQSEQKQSFLKYSEINLPDSVRIHAQAVSFHTEAETYTAKKTSLPQDPVPRHKTSNVGYVVKCQEDCDQL